MVRVFLDTNILLEPGKSKLDVWAELARVLPEPFEVEVLPEVRAELESLAREPSLRGRAAKLALGLLRQQSIKTPRGSRHMRGDAAILEAARAGDFVATLDKDLKWRLKARGVRIISVKQKTRLALED